MIIKSNTLRLICYLFLLFSLCNFTTAFSAVGGTVTTYLNGSTNYTVHTFTANDTFNVTAGGDVSVLVVGSGGGAGGSNGGGGGAGGLLYYDAFSVPIGNYVVTVGGKGLGDTAYANGLSGSNSTFSTISAAGGGGGGAEGGNSGLNGSSGGGGGGWYSNSHWNGNGTVGQGYNGGNGTGRSSPTYIYSGGCGGGAGGVGTNGSLFDATYGGVGISIAITGSDVWYAGGGGGAGLSSIAGIGGAGGGGNGSSVANGGNATVNRGGGGAGGGNNFDGGNGSAGIIIIRYLTSGGDTAKPTYTNFISNASTTTKVNGMVNFSVTLADETALSSYKFASNLTGTWVNYSSVGITGTSNYTSVLNITNQTRGKYVCGQFWFNDSSNNINQTNLTCFTVANTAPTMNSVNISYNQVPTYINSTLTANCSGSDADGNNLSYTYHWFINGVNNDGNRTQENASSYYSIQTIAYVYANYTKSADMYNVSWIYKHGNNSAIVENVSLPGTCYNQSILQFRYTSQVDVGPSNITTYGECYNGTDWQEITMRKSWPPITVTSSGFTNGGYLYDGNWDTCGVYFPSANWNIPTNNATQNCFYEEAIYIFSNQSTGNQTINPNLQKGTYIVQCSVSDGIDISSPLNSSSLTTSNFPPQITINSPINNHHDRINLSVNFTIVDIDSTSIDCSLFVNGSANTTGTYGIGTSIINATGMADATNPFNWYVSCTDGTNTTNSTTANYYVDTVNPVEWSCGTAPYTFPCGTNTTIVNHNVTTNITGLDTFLWGYNFTVKYSNGTFLFNEVKTNLTLFSSTMYQINRSINFTINDNYTFERCWADTHTIKLFETAKAIATDKTSQKIMYDFSKAKINISMISTDDAKEIKSVATAKLNDRYTFEFDYSDVDKKAEKHTYTFRVTSNQKVTYLPNSPYKGHIIVSNGGLGGYWVDFEGMGSDVKIIGSGTNYVDVAITTTTDGALIFNSIGGLNEICYASTVYYDTVKPTYTNFISNASTTTKLNGVVNFSVTLADEVALSSYKFASNLTGAWVNYSSVSITGTSNYVSLLNTTTLAAGNYTCSRFWFNDSAGNVNQTNNTCFTIAITPDIINPTYTNFISNASTTTKKSGIVNFSVNLADETNLSSYKFASNLTGAWVNYSSVSITGTSNYTSLLNTTNQTVGKYVCGQFWFNDSSNNINQTNLTCFTVANTAQTITTQNTFTNATAGHSFTVYANATDADGASNIVATNISTSSGVCLQKSNTSTGDIFGSLWNCSGTGLASANIIIGFTDAAGAYASSTQSTNAYPNQHPAVSTQNTFTNATAGHSFTVYANATDADGALDVNQTNISSSVGSCVQLLNTSSGNIFGSLWNCTGTALTSTNIIIGFTDAIGVYVNSTQSANAYPNQAPVLGNPAINNSAPIFSSVLSCNAGSYSDVDSDAEITGSRQWLWYVNGTATAITSQDFAISGNASTGANITCQERTYDAYAYSNYANSSQVSLNEDFLTVYATSVSTGMNITSFIVFTNDSRNFTSSGNVTIIPVVINQTYALEIHPTGYEWGYANVSITAANQSYQFLLYTTNSISISIFDEDTGLNLSGTNVSIKFTTNTTEFTNITNTSLFYIDNLNASVYTLLFSATGYGSRTYTVTVGNGTHSSLIAYLPTASSTTTFTVMDKDTGTLLSDVSANMYKTINGSWAIIESKTTDITGRSQFSYKPLTNYRFYLSYAGYEDLIFFLNPILFTSYDILMTKVSAINYSADFEDLSIIYLPPTFYNNQSNAFNFLIASPSGSLTGYGINVTPPGGSSNSTTGSNAIGGQLTINVVPNAASVFDTVRLDYYYITALSGRRNFTFFLPILFTNGSGPLVTNESNMTFMANKDRTYGLGIFERILICTLIALAVAGIATMVGQPIPGLVMSLFIFGYMSYIGFIPIWVILPSMFIGIMFVIWKGGVT